MREYIDKREDAILNRVIENTSVRLARTRITKVKKCFCGKEISVDYKFCPHCGANFEEEN